LERIELLRLILIITELMACISGFVHWKKIKHTHWKFFPIYLGLIVAIELVGKYLNSQQLYSANLALYNYFGIPLEMLFFIWLFYKSFAHTPLQRLPLIAAGLYFVGWLADMFLIPKGSYIWIGSFSYTLGIVMLLVLILTSLYKFATSNEIVFIKTNMMFWVCMGVFVFYSFSLPYYGMGNYLYNHYRRVYHSYSELIYWLNYVMYLLFTIAFIWGKPKSSYS
jgi:hypothetical protein